MSFFTLLTLAVSGCAKSEDETGDNKEVSGPTMMVPNYLAINAQPKDPDKQWYVSDYFKRAEQWEPEATDYSDLKMGMYELTQYPNQEPTQAHVDAANKLVKDSFDTVVRNGWLSIEKGLSDGYEKMYGDPVHFVNVKYVFDGETLNPENPEVLMYYKTKEGDFLSIDECVTSAVCCRSVGLMKRGLVPLDSPMFVRQRCYMFGSLIIPWASLRPLWDCLKTY